NKEYELALYVIKTLNQSDVLSVKLPDSEASSLVLHFVNAENKQDQVQDTVEITKLIAGIIQIVQLDFQETLDSKSFNYSRFITHLRGFMVNKMSKEDEIETEQELDPSFLNLMQAKYPEAYMTVQRIALYLKQQRNWQLSNNEQVYLTLHVWRVTHRQTTK
ncbi:MAG: PRD domain-containing protein, partial [Pediococcus sp.]|nr:PRD domain-containing protein [Pediococcus sp.]